MVNHLLETRHPLSSSAVRLCVRPVFRSFLYLLTSLPPYFLFSVHTSKFRIPQLLCLPLLRKHPGGVGVFFPFRNPLLFAFNVSIEAPQHFSADPDPVGMFRFFHGCFAARPNLRNVINVFRYLLTSLPPSSLPQRLVPLPGGQTAECGR